MTEICIARYESDYFKISESITVNKGKYMQYFIRVTNKKEH